MVHDNIGNKLSNNKNQETELGRKTTLWIFQTGKNLSQKDLDMSIQGKR